MNLMCERLFGALSSEGVRRLLPPLDVTRCDVNDGTFNTSQLFLQ